MHASLRTVPLLLFPAPRVCVDSGDHVGDIHQYLGCASLGMDAVAEIVTVLRQHEEAVLGQSSD